MAYPSKELSIEDTFYTFDDKLPIGLSKKDSIIFINFARSSQALSAINIHAKSLVDSFGAIGQGPDEVISPEFIGQTSDADLILADVNSKRIMSIKFDGLDMGYGLTNILDYPDEIYPASDISMSHTFITGRNLRSADAMFFIYNKNDKNVIDIPCYPPIKNLESRRNYFYAVRTAINENVNKIIAAHYFFNMFHVYTLEGKHIQSFALSEKPIPTIDIKSKEIDVKGKYTGINGVFSTESYYYMLIKTRNTEIKENILLIQCDWDGGLVSSYQINDDIIGGFFIDEEHKKMYTITQELNNEGNEIQRVVSYLLY